MASLGPLTYRRARYRSGASGASPVPVDESLGLVDDCLTRPAAELGLLMMGQAGPLRDQQIPSGHGVIDIGGDPGDDVARQV